MTHDELLERLFTDWQDSTGIAEHYYALRSVVELHEPYKSNYGMACTQCSDTRDLPYPCPTIKAIQKELTNGYK